MGYLASSERKTDAQLQSTALATHVLKNKVKSSFLDLIARVPDELWNEVHDIVQDTGSRPFPQKTNAKKQNGCLGRPYKQL